MDQSTANSRSGSTAKVVHLVEAASPQTCGTMLALLSLVREQAGRRSAVLLLGGAELERTAQAAGLRRVRRVGVPYGRAICGLPRLRRELQAVGQVDRVVCWSAGTLLAALLLRPATPRRLVVTQPMDPRAAQLVRWCLTRSRRAMTGVSVMGKALQGALVHGPFAGWGEGVDTLPALVLREWPSGPPMPSEPRGMLRERWRLADERIKVVALLSDPPTAADTQTAGMAVGLTRTVLRDTGWRGDVALLVHPDQWRRQRAQRTLEAVGGLYPLVLEAGLGAPWGVMAGCDAALTLGPGAGGASLGVAMAAGLPVVAEPTPRVSEWIEHGRTGRLAGDGRARSLARELTSLLRDPDMAGRLGMAARHAAARRHDAGLAAWLRAIEGSEPAATPGPTVAGHGASGHGIGRPSGTPPLPARPAS